MNIGSKLKKVGDLVDNHASVLDIGCDHAHLDIYLAQKNKTLKKIIASDNKKGPLDIAKKNVSMYQLQDRIKLKLGEGLDVYEEDIDTVIISGMGGRNMIGIFKNHFEYFKTINTIIISPNNYQQDIKKFLVKNGYLISDEYLVKEGKFIYQVIKFIKGRIKYSKKEYFLGPKLLEKKGRLFEEYYQKELKAREILLEMLPKKYYYKKWIMKKEIKILREALENSD